jgi:ribose transport system ATP-binding protein
MSVLRVENLTKNYPGTVALDNATIQFESGMVNAVIGKNGSGKSTLIKLISGVIKPNNGKIFLDEKELSFSNPIEAYDNGIATVYQELSLVPSLDVAENIFMGRLPMKNGIVNWKTVYSKAGELLKSMGVDISPKAKVFSLSMWQRQMVEIVKAMSHNPKVLLLDEPTSALAQNEVRHLFEFVRRVKEKDVIILYISHRLHELWQIADNCSVLRDGKYIGELEMKDATQKELLTMMFGDTKINKLPDDLCTSDEVVLKIDKLTRKGKFENVSFELYKGEILGIAGMLGSGRTELLKSIFGADPFDSGTIIVKDNEIKAPTPEKMRNLGVAMTQEDRKNTGLVQLRSVRENLCFASLDKLSKNGIMNKRAEDKAVEKQIDELQIKIPAQSVRVSSLSGGNQQKVVVGNWLNTDPDIILFDEPSRGIDVNAKQQIFQIMWEQSRRCVSSIMVSSELEELLEVCPRIIIMYHGEIIDEIKSKDCTVEQLYLKCMGGKL